MFPCDIVVCYSEILVRILINNIFWISDDFLLMNSDYIKVCNLLLSCMMMSVRNQMYQLLDICSIILSLISITHQMDLK